MSSDHVLMPDQELIRVFGEMLSTQNETNRRASGDDWIPRTLSGELNFEWACIDEFKEWADSAVHWKWWAKNKSPLDLDNARMELIDIFHFAMSANVVGSQTLNGEASLHPIFQCAAEQMTEGFQDSVDAGSFDDHKSSLIMAGEAIACLVDKDYPSFWREFFVLCNRTGLTLPMLKSIYFGKAELNIFRQENGYKTGQYRKTWTVDYERRPVVGEDNFHLLEFLKGSNYEVTREETKVFLQTTYRKFCESTILPVTTANA